MFNFAENTIGMTAAEILNYYRNLYYAEPQVTECGIVANAINDYFKEAAPRAEVAREIFEEIEKSCFYGGFSGDRPDLTIMTTKGFAELKKKYTEGK